MKTILMISFIALVSQAFAASVSAFANARENTDSMPVNENQAIVIDSLYAVMDNPKVPYGERINLLYQCYYNRALHREKLLHIIDILLPESKSRQDTTAVLCEYTFLAGVYSGDYDKTMYNVCLDSADRYVAGADNLLILTMYHFCKGVRLLNTPYDSEEIDWHFEMVMNYFNQTDQITANLLNPIATFLINQTDTLFASKLIKKLKVLRAKQDSPFMQSLQMNMTAILFCCKYETYQMDNTLDSAIAYAGKSIEVYKAVRDDAQATLSVQFMHNIVYSYLLIAKYYCMKKEVDWSYIDECLRNVRLLDIRDSQVLSLVKYLEAVSHFRKQEYGKAEQELIRAEKYLSEYMSSWNELLVHVKIFYKTEITYADLHSRILYAAGRYSEAMKYNKEKNDLKIEMRNAEISGLNNYYDTSQSNMKIMELKLASVKQMRYVSVLVIVFSLLTAIVAVFWLWYKTSRKNINTHIALMKAEKDVYELTLKLKEEQIVQMELEKYDILSESHLKELEIGTKSDAIQELRREKERLDGLIQACIQRIAEYEDSYHEEIDQAKKEHDNEHEYVMREIIKLIEKRFPDRKDYAERLGMVTPDFIARLRQTYNGNMSSPYVRYCICFLAGMNIVDIAECFSIEVMSIHTIRYRLKKKLGLGVDDDLDLYFHKLNGLD